MAKEAFNRKISLLTSKLGIDSRRGNKLVSCYASIWSIDTYGSEAWTLSKLEGKYLESFKIWRWRPKKKVKWSEKLGNEVLENKEEKRMILNNLHGKAYWIRHILRKNYLLRDAINQYI